MKLISLPSSSDQWSAFISGNRDADIFHTSQWIEFLASCYGYTPHLLAALDETQQIQGCLPLLEVNSWLTGHRVISLPFSDFCPPILGEKTNIGEFVQLLQDWMDISHWRDIKVHWNLPVDQKGVYLSESVFRHITNLTEDPSQIFRNFSKSQVQQSIKMSEKRGVNVRLGKSMEDIYSFYALHLQTRQRLGVPVQPLRFFRLLWERLISQGLGFVLLAYQGDQLLAGAVFLHYNNTLTYKFGASIPIFWNLRPNHAIFWRAIRWGHENGYKVFDWGRTDLDNASLREFKRNWAGEEQVINYTVLSSQPPALKSGSGFQMRVMKEVIQRSPLWVCRAVGELLYVHSA